MAEGLKKLFNSNTTAGRANVAKATYATFALIYLFYRVRRGSGEKLSADDPNCACDKEVTPPSAHAEQEAESNCAVCRDRESERQRRAARDEGGHDPPPPPPPSGGASATPPRRKCPCEDSHRHVESTKQHIRHDQQAIQRPELDEPHLEASMVTSHAAREVMGHMQEAASRVLRNVIGAVLGDTSSSAANGVECDDGRTCSCCNAASTAVASSEEQNYAGSEYEANSTLLSRHRRTAPRACVPNIAGEEQEHPATPEVELPETPSPTQTPMPNPQPQQQIRYPCFNDDFGSDMFYEDYDDE
ncbi:actin cytoskeleton-regulatory complex protein pan-1 [Drosophila busckii]|uniref:actin cytoskeleton-regulatory complex protein pan-1 n=1 Tax=Drosophila busckii TaxID=30019 RepID=UPI00143295C2|nr:actin cytoskeleton-regulatory complex protein pan-1 [Drosophila busckii]